MRTITRTAACPVCGQPAQLTLFQTSNVDGPAAHELDLSCRAGHVASVDTLLQLWADIQVREVAPSPLVDELRQR